MSYKFVNRPAVKTDIVSIVNYYNSFSPELAKQFLFRLREAKSYIVKSPFGFQVKYNKTRTLLLKQFPYHIHYFIDQENYLIVILAIIHAYKNPVDYTTR